MDLDNSKVLLIRKSDSFSIQARSNFDTGEQINVVLLNGKPSVLFLFYIDIIAKRLT